MASIFQSLLLVIAGATQRELARQVKYLKVENEILRSKLPERLTVTAKERERLLKFGAKRGKALHQLVTIVTRSTFLRWIREAKRDKKPSAAKRGRRRTAEDIRKLIVLMGRENGWGYTRILGELKKLRIRSVSGTMIRNILREAGIQPGPKGGELSSPGRVIDVVLRERLGGVLKFYHRRAAAVRCCTLNGESSRFCPIGPC